MTETPQEIIWRLEKECIRLRERAERAERRFAVIERIEPPVAKKIKQEVR